MSGTSWQQRKLPPGGLNSFGFFDYSDKGVLRTPLTPCHQEFMVDSGIVGVDCEMVGVGPTRASCLGRVSVVNDHGFCLYDKFVKPTEVVTDYRTWISGIRREDLENATSFDIVRMEVGNILQGHILVGHGLQFDLASLNILHPLEQMRDTANYYQRIVRTSHKPSLKNLTGRFLNVEIQNGEHNSIIDAQAAMALYLLCQDEWENFVSQSFGGVNIFQKTIDNLNKSREPGNASFRWL